MGALVTDKEKKKKLREKEKENARLWKKIKVGRNGFQNLKEGAGPARFIFAGEFKF